MKLLFIKLSNMKSFFLFLGICCFSYMVNAQKQLVVDPNAEMRPMSGSFHTIIVSGGIDLYLSQSDKEELAISASEDKFKSAIKTVVENNILRIYYEGDKSWGRNREMKAYVSFRELQQLEASGASDIVVAGEIKSTALLVKLSGASDFKGQVSVNALTLNLSGASDVSITGRASTVDINSSGASDVKGYDLLTDICTAKASGASDITITVNKELNAQASGASNIYFRGEAVLKDIKSSGASSVTRKDRS